MAYCGKCGAVLPEGTRFCPDCGAPALSEPERAGRPASARPRRRRKKKTPIWKKWWFWVLLVLLLGGLGRGAAKPAQSRDVPASAAPTARAATPPPPSAPTPVPTAVPTEAPTPEPTSAAPAENAVRPEVREFLDAYEACMDEYVEFMRRFNSDPGSMMSMMGDYYDMLARYTEFSEKLDALDESELTNAELAYYIEVTSRVSQKLLTVAGG